jgi:hypothetical protein
LLLGLSDLELLQCPLALAISGPLLGLLPQSFFRRAPLFGRSPFTLGSFRLGLTEFRRAPFGLARLRRSGVPPV